MYSPNVIAHQIIRARMLARSFAAGQRATLVALLPSLSGMVAVLATIALRNWSIEVA